MHNRKQGPRNKHVPNSNIRNRPARNNNSNKGPRNKPGPNSRQGRNNSNNKDPRNKPGPNSNKGHNSNLNNSIPIAGSIQEANPSSSKGRNSNNKDLRSNNNVRRVVNSIPRVAVNTVVATVAVRRNKTFKNESPDWNPDGAFVLYIPPPPIGGGRGAQFILYGAIK